MKSEWKERQLGSLCSRLSSGKGISAAQLSLTAPIPVYGGNGIRGYVHEGNFSGECAIIGRQGAYCGNVRFFRGSAYMTEHAVVVQANEANDTRFLAYKLSFMDLGRLSGQSAQPGLSVKVLAQQSLRVPSRATQRKIAAVLSSLDDKIETNHAICRNLEEQADAFYKQHFVSGEKSSWNEGKLSDLIDVKYGKDHKKLADGTIPVYGSGGLMRYAERALYESESVLIPRKGTLNNVMLVMAPFWTVDTMFYSVMKVKNAAKFVFHFLKGKDLVSMNAGSAVPSMTTEILNSMELRLPPKAVLADFEHNVAPIYQAIATKKCENDCLAALRDTLLPRLMSGGVDVSAVKL